MEFQPIVGSACANCHQRILVDLDGKNCKRCGLAVHRRCGKAHRAACANRPALSTVAHDYDEVRPLEWTTRLVVLLSLGAFVLAFGVGMVVKSAPGTDPAGATTAAPNKRVPIGWSLAGAGIVIAAAGYAWERSQQTRRARRPG
jgi:hypothetical protein